MPTFGKRSNEREATGGAGGFELFLKTFKDAQTRIRILEDNPETWVDYKEHFDNAMKMSFPCAKYEGAAECIGCDYPVNHPEWSDLDTHFPGLATSKAKDERKKQDKGWGVRDVSSKWVFPAIDPKGYVSVYKVGYNLWDSFKNLFGVLGSITSSEIVVVRSGTGFSDTNYTPTAVPGELREPKAAIPTAETISGILGKKYEYAMEKYGMEMPAADPAPVQQQPDPAPAGDEAQQAPEPEAPAETATTKGFIPREASTGEIKDWLSGLEPPVEFNAKAARGVLVALAERTMTERDIPPF